ncbi:MAG: hypothetical protein GY712_07940 [Oceanicoccus sp.]|uniref:hypothetical protein n=1 Tax=Oceanicoccus sp. TaxID=2691044 RepID=UPI00263053E3|nr:hypothetical protein [Oceanicoccus sp.]MCP3907932.1 hypothetical protein [Oceanicoccus sp.]MDG1773571.1 hypothetical protein [Oceanicoccus sp.]
MDDKPQQTQSTQKEPPQKLSTSALAKVLDVPSQQLFATLKDYGWIRKLDEGWALSSKGEFEGGEYVHSKRYGRYIVWPEELASHPLLLALEDNRHISATMVGKAFGLSAREVNRILAELGWIKHGFQGWELTAVGEQRGGIQLENDSSGTFYVVWPQDIQSNKALSKLLEFSAGVYADPAAVSGDMFANQSDYQGLDGHRHSSRAHFQICHWLYMAGIAHACQRELPFVAEDNPQTLRADFYLPAHQLYIECWDDAGGSSLAQRMQRKDIYQQYGCAVIDIEKDDLDQLDEVLTRQFRKQGIRVF